MMLFSNWGDFDDLSLTSSNQGTYCPSSQLLIALCVFNSGLQSFSSSQTRLLQQDRWNAESESNMLPNPAKIKGILRIYIHLVLPGVQIEDDVLVHYNIISISHT